jgi:putative restriction endonuclease
MNAADTWLGRIAHLRVYKARGGPAPHKPLLLLVLLDLAEQGELRQDPLPLTPELAFRFYSYWNIVAHRRNQRPDVRFPFHHLQSDGFWSALGEDGKSSPDDRLTRSAALAPDFSGALRDAAFREKARRILIANYFQHEERIALCAMVGLPVPRDDDAALDAAYSSPEEARKKGREARFRLNVVAAYNYTCALTGYRLTTIAAGSIVEAAHIHPFSRSRNNDPRNGLALCRNAHWLFDNGLWSLTDDYKVLVAVGRYAEDSPDQKPLHEYQGRSILLPQDRTLWPDRVHVAWHLKHRFGIMPL